MEQAIFTLGEAAKAAGKSKSTISRAIASGRLSAMSREGGEFRIAAAELFRVFPRNGRATGETERSTTPDGTGGRAVLQAKLEAAEQLVRVHEETIDDLRRRLDAEGEERRRLTALLTDQRQASPAAEPSSGTPGKPVEGRLARAWSIMRGKG